MSSTSEHQPLGGEPAGEAFGDESLVEQHLDLGGGLLKETRLSILRRKPTSMVGGRPDGTLEVSDGSLPAWPAPSRPNPDHHAHDRMQNRGNEGGPASLDRLGPDGG